MGSNGDFEPLPPPLPPPILNFEQAKHLAHQGWLPVDLPEDLQSALEALHFETKSFFGREHDEKIALYPPSRGTECGFYHVPEEKEYITLRHRVHRDTVLERHVSYVWHRVANLLHRILCDLSRAGYFDASAWHDMVDKALEIPAGDQDLENNISLMRLFQYYPSSGFAEDHVDVGLLTLCVGNGQGLQVLDRSHDTPQWLNAEQPTVLVGDMVRSLFRNRVRAGLHRVVPNPAGRTSLVFALRPWLGGQIDLAGFGGNGTVDTREYFYKIKGKKYNINATRDIRDQQIEFQRRSKDKVLDQCNLSLEKGMG